jgi:hypothetical protein
MRAGPGATVLVPEGEKNVDDCTRHGLLATTVLSHKWTPECVAALTGLHCIIPEDNDDDGRRTARETQQALAGVAASTRIVPTAHLWKYLDPERAKTKSPDHGDVSDWFDFGGDPAKLIDICCEIPADGAINAKPHDFPPEHTIAPWDFLHGWHLLRGTVSVIAAFGETGKSTKSIADALAQATGKALVGIKPPLPLRVLLINLEDNRNTMNKRIAAAMKHYELTPEDVGDRLMVIAKGELKIKIATQMRQSVIKPDESAIKGLTDFLIQNEIDVLSIDPLRKTHRVPENDIVGMGEVIECFEEIAEATNCAIHIWHHLRKANGSEATIDSVRGASSIIDSARSTEVMEKMTKEEAKKCKIEEHRRRYYFRSFNGKINFAPPIEQSNWFELKNVMLDNAAFGEEDQVGVVTQWTHPGSQPIDLTAENIEQIKVKVRDGEWREHILADAWVGKPIAQALGLDPEDDGLRIKALLKKLIRDGILKTVQGRTAKRKNSIFVEVNH